MRTYYKGTLCGQEVVVVFSRWGKVAAAATVTSLILEYGITELLFTGLSGAIAPHLKIGDVVIGDRFYQHDMDATPLYLRFEIPGLNVTHIVAPVDRVLEAKEALQKLLATNNAIPGIADEHIALFGLEAPNIYVGAIASGDKFFTDDGQKTALHTSLPNVLCVEMEGAAVAQVCYEYGIPFTIYRTVSDAADEKSEVDFVLFTQKVASQYSVHIIQSLLQGRTETAMAS
jgi:adenosylhomocysteine nucleosidase